MLCSKCNKRPAVVFVSNSADGQSKGYCLTCAKELGIKPVEDLINKMGITDDDLEAVQDQMTSIMDNLGENGDLQSMVESMGIDPEALQGELVNLNDDNNDDDEDGDKDFTPGGAPTFPAFFNSMFSGNNPNSNGDNSDNKKKDKKDKSKKNRKFINLYCEDLTKKAKNGLVDRVIGRDKEIERIIQILSRRTKLILLVCYIVLIFCTFNFYALGVTIALAIAFMLLSRVPVKQYLKSMKMMIVIIIITSVFNLFYGGGKTYLTIGPLSITEGGINNSIFIVTRIVCLLIASASLTFTTSPTDLTAGIEMLMKPLKVLHVKTHEIAMMMSIALRFVPTLLEETDKIMLAQKSRGANMDEGNIIKRAKALIPVFIPLFVSAFRRAFDLAMAMECRCYNGGNGRTKLNTLKLSKRDYFSYITFLLLIGVIVVCNIFLGSVVR